MQRSSRSPHTRRASRHDKRPKVVNRIVESDLIRRVSFDAYRHRVQRVYEGPRGALLAMSSALSLHSPLSERWLKTRKFDLRGLKSILDIGSGAGQIVQHLLKYADPDAQIVGLDLSFAMLRRARQRLKSRWPRLVVGDITRLPFADGTFDCVTCGYVLEHLPDARLGLNEISRIMRPGGRMLLLTTEESFGGAFTSRVWRCRTYRRDEIREQCLEAGLVWNQELWFSNLHKAFRAGGICVEIQKRA